MLQRLLQFSARRGLPRARAMVFRSLNVQRPTYKEMTDMFAAIEKTQKRIEIQNLMTNFIIRVVNNAPHELLPSMYLACNKVAPQFKNVELGIGDALIQKALAAISGRGISEIKDRFKATGDLGIVAEEMYVDVAGGSAGLEVGEVHRTFLELASYSGAKSQERKIDSICNLLKKCQSEKEQKYIIRSLQKKMRLGLAEQTVLSSLGQAARLLEILGDQTEDQGAVRKMLTDKSAKQGLNDAAASVKKAFSMVPSYDIIVGSILKGGVPLLPTQPQLGVPIQPMLSRPARSVEDAVKILSSYGETRNGELPSDEGLPSFACEWKYDGERGQIHMLEDGTVQIFSRNMENSTERFPDIVSVLKSCNGFQSENPVQSCILDCEFVAFDRATNAILPFQVLSTRGRKHVSKESVTVDVLVLPFDLLHINGESTLDLSYTERQRILRKHIVDIPGRLELVSSRYANSVEEIEEYLSEAIQNSCEGLMIKSIEEENSSYNPSKRSSKWLKLKEDYLDGFGDSLDLVPIGAWMGRGKRSQVYGTYLCACLNAGTGMYETVCKLGTGMSDYQLEEFYNLFQANESINAEKPANYHVNDGNGFVAPDVWIDPTVVWEVKGASLSLSPTHTAGIGQDDGTVLADASVETGNECKETHEKKGIALRFPRLLRVRDDKSIEDISTSEDIKNMLPAELQQRGGAAYRK